MEEQHSALREEKKRLEDALRHSNENLKGAQDQAAHSLQRADAGDREVLELRRKLAEAEQQLAQLRLDQATQAGALEEMRRQTSLYQQRLVQSKETTDSDVLRLRQDLQMFLEELRMIRGSMRKGE